jgi:hypothetical protein
VPHCRPILAAFSEEADIINTTALLRTAIPLAVCCHLYTNHEYKGIAKEFYQPCLLQHWRHREQTWRAEAAEEHHSLRTS